MNGLDHIEFSRKEIEKETERLFCLLMDIECAHDHKWTLDACRQIAPITLEINQLKKEKNAIILAHSYTSPDIVYGVADFKSDSYALSLEAKKAEADVIVFAGVVFMAETAKIVCPNALVVVPDPNSGCSLADSIRGKDVRDLKRKYPEAVTVCYINTNAEVKAESDICVTSTNVFDIVEKLPQNQILFIPDRLMADNLRIEMRKRGINKEIISSDGTCEVHDQFKVETIYKERSRFPDLKVVSHPECVPEITELSDFVGSTGAMMKYVKNSSSKYYMMLTECGLISRLEAETKGKTFISACKICPYMKMNDLYKIRNVLRSPRKDQIISLDPTIVSKAGKAIDRMFEFS